MGRPPDGTGGGRTGPTPRPLRIALALALAGGLAAVAASRLAPPDPAEALRQRLRTLQAGLLMARDGPEEARLLAELAALEDPGAPRWRVVLQARPRDLRADRPVAPGDVRADAPPFAYGADVDAGRLDRDTGAGRRLLVFRLRLREAAHLALLGVPIPGAPSPAPEVPRGP